MPRRALLAFCLVFNLALGGCVATSSQELANIFDSGVAAYDAGDYPKAYKIWSSITDEDVAAMRNVAMMLRSGQGVPKNPQAAASMYMRAAEAGLPTAQADLADMLLKGELGPPNPKAALPLLQSAASANHPVAQYELAQLYEAGEVVPKDLEKARSLYAEAASRGMTEASDRLRVIGPPAQPQTPLAGAPAISSP
jgi:TPR repeat protein